MNNNYMAEARLTSRSATVRRESAEATAKATESRRRAPGRPRNAERHAAILRATRELVLEAGYSGVTLEAVAKRSGASRTTLYQWWGSCASLVEEAILSDYGEWPVPDTGCFDDDLAELLEEIVNEMSRPHVARALPALTAEVQANPEIKAGLRARYGDPMTIRWRGELPGSDAEAALQLTIGAVLMMTQSNILPRKKLKPYLLSVLVHGLAA